MNVYLLIYILVCIFIGSGGALFLYQSGRPIGGATFFIGALLIFIFFGIRWFQFGDSTAGKMWPPVINTCPDYLVYYEHKITGSGGETVKEDTCVDPLGVSTNPTALFKWPGAPPQDDNPAYYFSLKFDETDPIKLAAAKCERSLQKGVSWEGVTDGDSCYKYKGPATGGGGGGSGGNCPKA